MKNTILLSLLAGSIACSNPEKKPIEKTWLGKQVNFDQISEVVNTYHMFDSTETKVGSMIFGTYFENGQLVSRDTSMFDNGSVYEEASFVVDTSDFTIRSVDIAMSFGPTSLLVDLEKKGGNVSGFYQLSRDTLVNKVEIDSAYSHDVFRSELYMLLHTLDYQRNDTLRFTALAPSSMSLSPVEITYEGEETITVPGGTFDCDVIWLRANGSMPTNKIWISKEEKRKMVKFYVPGPELDIEFISSVVSTDQANF